MKKIKIALITVGIFVTSLAFAQERVSFFQDTVSEIDGRVVKFLTGSVWLLEMEILALPFDEGIMVFRGHDPRADEKDLKKRIINLPHEGIFYYEGNRVSATLVSGFFIRQNGCLSQVIESLGDGAVLKMTDGSIWSVPKYDQYDTSYWLPPYPVLIYSSELHLFNLKKGKRIWINRIK